MNDHVEPRISRTAAVRRQRRFPLVWIVPIVTALIGAWLYWDTVSKRGPTITVSFESAAGLTAGQSQLKYKDVTMGTVKSITVAPDLAKVLVTIETVREAEKLLTDKTVFWIVKPGLFAGSLTGLDTLISGSYIGMRPSTEEGKAQRDYVGMDRPPIFEATVPGTRYRLRASRIGTINLGSPVFFRDIEVGSVLGWDLEDLATQVNIHVFVRAPYDKYVHDDTWFWNASGLEAKLGPNGIEIKMESLKALLIGGIAFDHPDGDQKADVPSAPRHTFRLHATLEQAKASGFGVQMHLRSIFPGSVSGLEAGADVTFHGLRVGEVTKVGLTYDPISERIVAPVEYRIQPERIVGIGAANGLPPGTIAERMVRSGLRATLQAPSLISGQKIVALEVVPDAPPAKLELDGDVLLMPSSSAGGFDSVAKSANELLAKINRIDIDAIGKDVAGITRGLDSMVNGLEFKRTLADLASTMASASEFTHKLDVDAGPALKRLPAIADQLEAAVAKTNVMVGSINTGYGENSKFLRDLDRLLPQLTDSARSLRALLDLLDKHPEALIKGRSNTDTK